MDCQTDLSDAHQFPIQDKEPSAQITTATAKVDETDPLKLPPLSETINPEALDTIVQDANVTLSFDYAGYTICITDSEEILITK